MGSWDELSGCSSCRLVGDVVASDGRGGWLPGKVDGGRGQRCELQVGGSLDNWFHCRGDFRTLDHLATEMGSIAASTEYIYISFLCTNNKLPLLNSLNSTCSQAESRGGTPGVAVQGIQADSVHGARL